MCEGAGGRTQRPPTPAGAEPTRSLCALPTCSVCLGRCGPGRTPPLRLGDLLPAPWWDGDCSAETLQGLILFPGEAGSNEIFETRISVSPAGQCPFLSPITPRTVCSLANRVNDGSIACEAAAELEARLLGSTPAL